MRVHAGLSTTVRLHVERAGAGDPVVLTHGGGATSGTWAAQVASLSTGWSVTTWDLRGHGRSERPDDPGAYTRDLALADLEDVTRGAIEASGSGAPALLVGHSLGGYLSLALAITRPELVRGIVAIATGPGFRDPAARKRWNDGVTSMGDRLGVPAVVAGIVVQPDSLVIDGLAGIAVPVLAVVGSRDERFHAGTAYVAERTGGRVLVVEGARHLVHETHAGEVDRAIAAFAAAL